MVPPRAMNWMWRALSLCSVSFASTTEGEGSPSLDVAEILGVLDVAVDVGSLAERGGLLGVAMRRCRRAALGPAALVCRPGGLLSAGVRLRRVFRLHGASFGVSAPCGGRGWFLRWRLDLRTQYEAEKWARYDQQALSI